ncbi:MAG: ABC transporter ATP-binding protein [Erysipelotrichia bacterium]|nr:ABC transporter ATP-binding protein [Erysipelotrichia bacterium]
MSNIQFEEKSYNTDSLDLNLWKRILALLGNSKSHLIKLGLFMIMTAAIDVARPYLDKIAIDYFAVGNIKTNEVVLYAVVYIVVIVLNGVLVSGFTRQSAYIESGFLYDIRDRLFEKVQKLSYSYFDKTPTGWIMSRLSSDVGRLAEIFAWSLTDLVWGVAVMIASSVIMLKTNWRLALIVLAIVPILAIVSMWFQIRILRNYRSVRAINSKITNAFNEGITGAKTTKTLVLEDENLKEFKQLTAEYRHKSNQAAYFSSAFMPIVIGLSAISLAFILWYGGNQVLLEKMQFGTLLMFTEYASQFFEPLKSIAGIIAELQMAQASAERVLSLLEEEVEITDTAEVIKKYGTVFDPIKENYPRLKGDVEFEHVDFSYIKDEPILSDFNLKVKAGQSIALVGETGSGKSTIINLICRFYQPTSGRILIDGIDYKQRSLGWLHSNIGYVLQTPTLFTGTIRDNIRYGKFEATDEEIKKAAEMVGADSFINKLENGYDSEVGEQGSKLSTGEKQLISFARAIVANPALFILDEATSSVDTETEKKIQKAIDVILRERTSFIVAHRLSTIVNADKILVIDKGRIVESGKHDELMNKKGYYYRLYINQFNKDLQNKLLGDMEL